ncbi:histone-lysine N-methyltransferase SETMAR [Trichonephila clavipes]|nr:histone-lysine N-methyltransferase SETMAR [Trichonephila clavipes]
MEVNKEKIRLFLHFLFDKGENASQGAEIANGVYGADTVTASYVQFWFCRFRSGIFDFKDSPHTGRPVIENVYKITEIIEVDRDVRVVVSPWSKKSSIKQFYAICTNLDSRRIFGCHTN